ncbi:2'-5' RNA ligase family protein [Radiobacillus kanasensis]|uniref:2'-5' RNA ligase family protein n=1 Tax=Radiobacillus kanasensis TaxID=2844358 RepID=UPI001E592503|nr:2'-5' RNA ligase family protein [Radiobacillus kanasensis]UFT98326.1 2'-5' RNA ligase family protein [Radiobacillus kanasensis]
MIKRSICIFPFFENIDKLELWREKYDPLYGKIAPHVTLVFPFESELSSKMIGSHVSNALKEIKPFELEFSGFSVENDSFLFIDVERGYDTIVQLHNRLYTGILKQFLRKDLPFKPHLTIGRFVSDHACEEAFQVVSEENLTFQTAVTEVVVEVIEEDESSTVECRIRL